MRVCRFVASLFVISTRGLDPIVVQREGPIIGLKHRSDLGVLRHLKLWSMFHRRIAAVVLMPTREILRLRELLQCFQVSDGLLDLNRVSPAIEGAICGSNFVCKRFIFELICISEKLWSLG